MLSYQFDKVHKIKGDLTHVQNEKQIKFDQQILQNVDNQVLSSGNHISNMAVSQATENSQLVSKPIVPVINCLPHTQHVCGFSHVCVSICNT